MRTLSLDQLTVCGVRPAELVEIAARNGYGAIGPFLIGNADLPAVPLRAGDPDTLAMARRLKDTGVFINNADGFLLHDAIVMEDMRIGIDLMAEMGARAIVTLQFDSDAARGFDHFCLLREWAAAAGLRMLLEFTPLSQVVSFADALAYREQAGGENIQILVDIFHLHQSGGSPADVAAVDPQLIGGAQLCDGPARMTAQEYAWRALFERTAPGQGAMPVREFLAALPPDLVYGIEAPSRSLREAGLDYDACAAAMMRAARALEPTAGGRT